MVVITWYEIRTSVCTEPTQRIGNCCWTGHGGSAWVALEKQCLLEWAVRRGISPLPLKQWAVGSGSAAGQASTPVSQIRQKEMAPEAAHNTRLTLLLQTHVYMQSKDVCMCLWRYRPTYSWEPSLSLSLFSFRCLITVCRVFHRATCIHIE